MWLYILDGDFEANGEDKFMFWTCFNSNSSLVELLDDMRVFEARFELEVFFSKLRFLFMRLERSSLVSV